MNHVSFFPSLSGKILLLTHAGADVDAVASAAALFLALKKKHRVEIGIPEHLNLTAKAFASNMKISYKINPKLAGFDTVVLVDFNTWEMTGRLSPQLKSFKGKIYALDHHTIIGRSIAPAANSVIKENAVSTTEIIYELFNEEKIEITPDIASCIAAGIVTDSAHFLVADAKAFHIMADVLEKSGRTFSGIVGLFRVKMDFSKKVAKLKAAKRARIFKIGEKIVVTADIGAYEADAATTLTRIGADVAFAGDLEKGELRISGRATSGFVKETDFDLAKDVFLPLEKTVDGAGGGHAGAAAFNGKAKNLEDVLQKCVSLVEAFLKKRNPKVQLKEYT